MCSFKFRWPWSKKPPLPPSEEEPVQDVAVAAPPVIAAVVALPVVMSPSEGQQIAGAKYRIDAMKRYIEQTAVISAQKMMEFEEECYALRKRIRDLSGEQIDISFLGRGA